MQVAEAETAFNAQGGRATKGGRGEGCGWDADAKAETAFDA